MGIVSWSFFEIRVGLYEIRCNLQLWNMNGKHSFLFWTPTWKKIFLLIKVKYYITLICKKNENWKKAQFYSSIPLTCICLHLNQLFVYNSTYMASTMGFWAQHAGCKSTVQHVSFFKQVKTLFGSSMPSDITFGQSIL